ncbi:hypothetical protein CEXT_6701 [Caerostris extrusa]|uniref:Uncharacterized protein n=1 Tax=Caerostris extrusa TaxID=172846 RepID=A0AAV4MHZ2_CAEEX|nr:hypothetical protein CEXT_6701 [Caerostris extrusa]
MSSVQTFLFHILYSQNCHPKVFAGFVYSPVGEPNYRLNRSQKGKRWCSGKVLLRLQTNKRVLAERCFRHDDSQLRSFLRVFGIKFTATVFIRFSNGYEKGWVGVELSSTPLMPRDASRFGPYDGFICVRDCYPRHISVPTPFLPMKIIR